MTEAKGLRWSRPILVRLAAGGLTVLLATACSQDLPDVVVSHSQGAAPNATPVSPTGPAAAWADDRTLLVVTWGSGSCPNLPGAVTRGQYGEVRITTEEWHPPGSNGCSMDLSPTTSTVRVPDGVDVTGPVTVTIDGQAVTLPPAS